MSQYHRLPRGTAANQAVPTSQYQLSAHLLLRSVAMSMSVCCVTFAESEPYCHSILFVCLSVGHLATYSLPRLINHNQIWSASIYLSSDPCKPFWIPYLPYFRCQREKYAKSCHCERDASCHMTCLFVCLPACLSAPVTGKAHDRTLTNFLCILPVAIARFSSDGVVICYVLTVLMMTLYFHTMDQNRAQRYI